MPTFIADEGTTISVPRSAHTLDGFLEWLDTEELPEKTRVWFLRGDVVVDLSLEQLFTHVVLKGEIALVLREVVKGEKLGRVFPHGALLVNRDADISGNPDAMFVSNDALASGRVVEVPGKEGGFTALEGTPDLVVEVVSDSSERKDNQTLFEAYWEAGIPEYWLVDARGNPEFTLEVK